MSTRRIISTAAKVGLLCAAVSAQCYGQGQKLLKIGLRFAPTLSFTRVNDKTKTDLGSSSTGGDIAYSAGSPTVGFSSGIVVDYYLRSNYALSTGVMYTIKRGAVDADQLGKAYWNMQMIQVPIMLKLFTNEIAPDMKLYFQVGFSPDFIINQKLKKYQGSPTLAPKTPERDPYIFFDVSLWFGTGVEYRIGEQTILFAGLSYNRGLINLVNKYGAFNEYGSTQPNLNISTSNSRYSVRSDVAALDLGIKF